MEKAAYRRCVIRVSSRTGVSALTEDRALPVLQVPALGRVKVLLYPELFWEAALLCI